MQSYNEGRAEYKRKRYAERRILALTTLGGKCARCGSLENLEVDHIDSTKKEKDLMTQLYCYALEKFMAELLKCQILCHDCHLQKTRECGDNTGGKKSRRIAKITRSVLPEHGLAGYDGGCRCEECRKAKYEYRLSRGEVVGPQKLFKTIIHGTRAGYQKERRQGLPHCKACRKANSEATLRLRKSG
jgi:hypothetical protein